MLERIWSGWRAAYVGSAPREPAQGSESPFTQLLASGEPDEVTHIVHRGEHVFAVMNLFPYASGHLLVVPYREVPDLDDLAPDETAEFWATVTDGVAAVRAAYSPEGTNVGLNLGRPSGGSIPNHLHGHVVPRWTGDSNFMSTIANTQTLPEALDASAARIRAAWPTPPDHPER